MKALALYFLFVLTLPANISYAQNSILAGKIVDENDKPIPCAIIHISKQGILLMETRADDDGLYYSKLLDDGTYHVDVITKGKLLKAKKLYVYGAPGEKKYYIIKVYDNKVIITKTDEDPSLKVKLGKIEDMDWRKEAIYDRTSRRGLQ